MRVLTVGNMYPPHHYGGYELVWRSAVEHLRARGHEVRVLTTDTHTDTKAPEEHDVHRELRWQLRDGDFVPLGLRASLRLARHNHRVLERHLDEFRPDVVGWWSMGGLPLTLLESVRRRGLPAVAFVHDEWLDYGRAVDPWLRWLRKRGGGRLAPLTERLAGVPAGVDYDGAATYVFVSEFVRRHALGLALGLRRTTVAQSGIHPDFLAPAPEVAWRGRLLYVGRTDPRKGIDTAMEALAQLPQEATLTVAGGWDTREEERLRAAATRLGVAERVVFAGQLEREQLLGEYESCDAVVFPVRWNEPWGLVPLEAMGRGRPVVATGRGGSGEYLRDGENCLLFDAEDPVALAAAIRRLASEPELRARLRERGFDTAARHTEPVFNAAVETALADAPGGGEPTLRILHVGAGFRPWRRGGLVAYVEDLVGEQIRRGHDVSYLFSGRHYRFARGPRLKRWQRGATAMLEVINSPLYDHGRQPELELSEPRLERIVQRQIEELRPDVVHVHELAGLPSSVLEVARRAGAPVVATLQDYFPLCPTFRLLDFDGRVCLRPEIGEDCVATTRATPQDAALLFEATARHDLHHSRLMRRLDPQRRDRWAARLARWSTLGARRRREEPTPAAFQRRRDVNVARLSSTDRLVAMSRRVAEIYSTLGVEDRRLEAMQLTLGHIEHLRPRRGRVGDRVTFATLGGGESPAKGSRLLLGALGELQRSGHGGRFRLLVFGFPDEAFARAAADIRGVELRGLYAPDQLDELLEEVDVGIMPSIWEEAYGYAGVEFLAKGIPVIANAIGGIVEYVRDGETGWLNRSCSAAGLAGIMRELIERPHEVAELGEQVRARRASIVMPLSRHAADMDRVYREAMAA